MVKKISLLLVILSLFALFSCGPDPEDEFYEMNYVYVNKSNFDIELSLVSENGKSKIRIKKDSTFLMKRNTQVEDNFHPFSGNDSITTTFSDTFTVTSYPPKYDFIRFGTGENYEKVRVDEYTYRCTYTFTNEDYEYAKKRTEEVNNGGN